MKQIAIISGKGGTGKSSISAAFATLNGQVVLADCDVDAANQYLLFKPSLDEETIYTGSNKAFIDPEKCSGCNICVEFCRFDAISITEGMPAISAISCDGCFLCSRICPSGAISMLKNDKSRMFSGSFRNGKIVYGRLAPGEENSGKLVNMVREKAKEISGEYNLDTIILDGPPGTGCPVISTITGVDKVIIVTEPTISGLSDLKRVFRVIRHERTKTYVIVNKYDLNIEMSRVIEEWCIDAGVDIAGYIPFDTGVIESMIQEQTITEMDRTSIISQTLTDIWNYIIN